MKNLFIFSLLLLVVGCSSTPGTKSAGNSSKADELTICTGEYALCAASTCTPTGKTITTNNGVTYPEVTCTCPVLNGKAIADLSAGTMKGSCLTELGQVWSLFAPKVYYPQEASNFSTKHKDMRAKVQSCGSTTSTLSASSANCFGMSCTYGKVINGTQTADCSCPIGQLAPNVEFLTEAGQGDSAACSQNPVSAPNPF